MTTAPRHYRLIADRLTPLGRYRHGPALALAIVVRAAEPSAAFAHTDEMGEIVVTGRAEPLLEAAGSASQGRIGRADLEVRPILRAGELLEVVPGAAVTQHSGTGKANQYFLRGFNLDHGTDFAGFLDGVPLNQRTHGHGQGYLDLNPIIPELVESIDFGKGTYYADVGDFGSAGYARYTLSQHLHESFVKFTGGENNFYRAVAANSTMVGPGELLTAVEAQYYDGPWALDEDAHKLNGLLKYTGDVASARYGLSLLAYDAEWTSTDQVPERAVRQDIIPRLGNIDPTLGGASARYGLNLELGAARTSVRWRATAYAVYSDFELYSNFTYFLDDPVNGDQITQQDRRWTTGLDTALDGDHRLLGLDSTTTVGVQVRRDDIVDLALLRSRGRRPLSTVRSDDVEETSAGIYLRNETALTPWLRAIVGLRADQFWFDVESDRAVNSGSESDGVLSPKATLVFGPWRGTELYLNFGRGFHSNDARGTVTRIDPASGDAAVPVDPLVQSLGGEVGVRTLTIGGLQSTVSLWYLELDSELLFVGDAGTTEPSGASERYGVEWSNFYRVNGWLTLDLDVAFTHSRFSDEVEDEVPGSVGRVVTAGPTIDLPNGLFGTLRLRHFGDVPLTEDRRIEAGSTTVVNFRAGYRWRKDLEIALDVFNLLDSKDPDIAYFFESCLPSDPAALCGAGLAERAGVSDIHSHPVEPRQLRATLTWRF